MTADDDRCQAETCARPGLPLAQDGMEVFSIDANPAAETGSLDPDRRLRIHSECFDEARHRRA